MPATNSTSEPAGLLARYLAPKIIIILVKAEKAMDLSQGSEIEDWIEENL